MQKKIYICLLLVLASWLFPFSAYTQTYPVTISTQLTQPSPIYLSNYANTASINSPIKVQLILNDLTIMNRQVRLKCYFQGAVSFVTNDFVVGASPIYLEGGFPTLLTNVELGHYFEFQNLQGINPNQYAQPLPEGIYTISFEVYDFATNKKLSKKSSVTTVIFQNEPPFLNLPANKAGIVEQNIQNVIFSWTPRSINVSNVEYEFSLAEIWNTNTPIQNAFAYSPPLYTTTTRNTTIQYSIAEPQLIPGKTYAWRVKAKALVGAEEIGVFKNNGYSEIFSFKYLTLCNAPIAITTTNVSQDQAKITWSGAVDNYDYQINYREKNANSKWYPLVTPREYATISNLKPKTTYEYTVGAACDPGEYTQSNIQEFTTMAQDEIAFVGCGIKPDPAALSNKTPLPALFPNDVVTAGDFPIVVLKSTGSNGTFSGEGYVTLPFLEKFRELIDAATALAGKDEGGNDKSNIGKYTRIRITFNNIGVNTDFKLISGEIVASYDPNWGGMVDGDKLVNDIMGDTGTVIPIDIQFEIKSVVKNLDGSLTITGPNKIVVQLPKNENDVIITDRNGNQYAISPNAQAGEIKSTGKAAPGGVPTPQNTNGMGSGGNIKEISSADVSITFAAGTGFYSLDENPNQDPKLKANTKLNNTYDIIPKKDGTSYYVHYKVISDAPKAEDYVTAKATFSNGKTIADIIFKTENGTEIKPSWSGNVATLPLKRTLDFAKESILATVKPPVQKEAADPKNPVAAGKYDIAGTLNLWHMTGKKVNITLVGLNGGETPTQNQAKEYLNSIYSKAGIQFEVSTVKIDIADTWVTSIETGDSDLLNTYTDGQQTITNNFQTKLGTSYKTDTYYVLFTKVPSSKPGTLGFMPLKRQFGFVFSQPEDKKLHTLAHELGHGVFGLQHPFTEYNTAVPTDLLMDYGTGTVLSHNDWEIMHAPGLQLYQFTQGSSAGELAGGYGLTPNFEFVSAELSNVIVPKTNLVSEGMLSGFKDDGGNEWVWNKEQSKYTFLGANTGSSGQYDLTPKKKLNDDEIVWLIYKYSEDCSKIKFIKTKYEKIKKIVSLSDKVEAQKQLDAYLKIIDSISKQSDPNIYSGFLDCGTSSNNGLTNTNSDGKIVFIRDCNKTQDGTIAYNQKPIVSWNNGATWGEIIVENLNRAIKINAVNKGVTDLKTVKVDGLQYINPTPNYRGIPIFEPQYIEELNNKLAYLEASSGVQLYINFIDTNCSFTDKEGLEFAKAIFDNSQISKTNGIYSLTVKNRDAIGNQYGWKTYFVFGTNISESIKKTTVDYLSINTGQNYNDYGKSIISFYQKIPKKQLQYIYVIEKVTPEEIKNAPTKSFLEKNILKKIVTVEGKIGNAIQAIFLFKDTQTNTIVSLNEKEDINRLKEQYVADESLNLAKRYADQYADWRLTYFDFDKPEYEDGIVSIVPHISECKFTLNKTCIEQYIDDAFLVAGIASIPFGNVAVITVDGLAVVYYASIGQSDMALMYVAGYLIGPVLGETFNKIATVYKNSARFTKNFYLSTSLSLQIAKGLDEVAIKNLINLEIKNSTTAIEYLLPKATSEADVFIKATDNEMIIGYAKNVAGKTTPELTIINYETGINQFTGKIATATEEELELIYQRIARNKDVIVPANFFKNANALGETYDAYNKLSKSLRGEIFNHYKQQNWSKIEEIFKEYKLNDGWPPANGGYNTVEDISILKGQKFDRYQEKWFGATPEDKPIVGGSYVAPIKDTPYSYAQRALRVTENKNALYYEIEILKDLPITGTTADVIPWFGQVGNGKQTLLKFDTKYKNLQSLIDDGYIKINVKSSPNKLYTGYIGKVLEKEIVVLSGNIIKKVVLGGDDLSKFAVEFRKTLAIPNHKGNVAVFEYLDNSGNLVKKAFTTEVGVTTHSEQLAKTWIEANNIPKSNVKRIFSELEPCELEASKCKEMLNTEFSGAQKSYSYDYPGNNTTGSSTRQQSLEQRFNDLIELLK